MELGVFFAPDGELSFGDFLMRAFHFPTTEADGGDDEGSSGSFEFCAECLDELDKVLLVAAGCGFAAILMPLPPGEAGDLISAPFPVGEFLVEICEDFLGGAEAIIVLLSGIPFGGRGLAAFFPTSGGFFVAGVDVVFMLELLTSWWKKVP